MRYFWTFLSGYRSLSAVEIVTVMTLFNFKFSKSTIQLFWALNVFPLISHFISLFNFHRTFALGKSDSRFLSIRWQLLILLVLSSNLALIDQYNVSFIKCPIICFFSFLLGCYAEYSATANGGVHSSRLLHGTHLPSSNLDGVLLTSTTTVPTPRTRSVVFSLPITRSDQSKAQYVHLRFTKPPPWRWWKIHFLSNICATTHSQYAPPWKSMWLVRDDSYIAVASRSHNWIIGYVGLFSIFILSTHSHSLLLKKIASTDISFDSFSPAMATLCNACGINYRRALSKTSSDSLNLDLLAQQTGSARLSIQKALKRQRKLNRSQQTSSTGLSSVPKRSRCAKMNVSALVDRAEQTLMGRSTTSSTCTTRVSSPSPSPSPPPSVSGLDAYSACPSPVLHRRSAPAGDGLLGISETVLHDVKNTIPDSKLCVTNPILSSPLPSATMPPPVTDAASRAVFVGTGGALPARSVEQIEFRTKGQSHNSPNRVKCVTNSSRPGRLPSFHSLIGHLNQ